MLAKLRGCDPGVSDGVRRPLAFGPFVRLEFFFICKTGESASLCCCMWSCTAWPGAAAEDGGLDTMSMVEADPFGTWTFTMRLCPAGVWKFWLTARDGAAEMPW
jgi:hypothetical protein